MTGRRRGCWIEEEGVSKFRRIFTSVINPTVTDFYSSLFKDQTFDAKKKPMLRTLPVRIFKSYPKWKSLSRKKFRETIII